MLPTTAIEIIDMTWKSLVLCSGNVKGKHYQLLSDSKFGTYDPLCIFVLLPKSVDSIHSYIVGSTHIVKM